jgi:hypothetical protein
MGKTRRSIEAVWCIVENSVLAQSGAAATVINPPVNIIPDSDARMATAGLIEAGSLIKFVEKNGFSGTHVTAPLNDKDITSLIAKLTSNSDNANNRMRTPNSCYNVVAVFEKKNAWWRFWGAERAPATGDRPDYKAVTVAAAVTSPSADTKPEGARSSQDFISIPYRLDRPNEETFDYLLAYWRETPLDAIQNDFRALPIESIRLGQEVGNSRRQRFLYDLTESLCHGVVQYRYWQARKKLPNLPAESLAELIVPRFISTIVRSQPFGIHYAIPRRVVFIAEQFMQFRPLDSIALAQWLIEVAKYWPSGDINHQTYAVPAKKARSLHVAGAIQNAKNTKTKEDVNTTRSLMEALLRDYPEFGGTEIDREARALQDAMTLTSQPSKILPSATSLHPCGPVDMAELDILVDSGRMLEAIKWYRGVTNCGLREASDDVEAYRQSRLKKKTAREAP